MKVGVKIRPGERGSKKLLREYGDKLVCVRYRYDRARGMRLTTVELVVDQSPWTPPASRFAPAQLVRVSIEYHEKELRGRIKANGARWDSETKTWELPYFVAEKLHLKRRIISS